MVRSARADSIDPESLRPLVAAGKLVRVSVAPSAQFPEGTVGRIRRIGDPAADGPEYVQVELSIDGTKDILPFAPADLGSPTRKKPVTARTTPASGTRRTVGPRATAATRTGAEPARTTARGSSRTATAAPRQLPLPAMATAPAAPAPTAPAPSAPALPTASPGPAATSPPPSDTPRTARKGPAKSGKPGPQVTITLSSTPEPGQWKIEAKVGTRSALRATAVPTTRVWQLVQSLDTPALSTAVQTHLDEQRRTAARKADQLRAELAAVQAELDALSTD